MQPQSNTQADQFKPKWRHFHPQSTVWILNPFDHDVIWKVADENNNQSEFRVQARERAELPGGAIATLGLKAIIDEMIQNNKQDQLRLHDLGVRAGYEVSVILRVKEAPQATMSNSNEGPIDLSIGADADKPASQEEQAKESAPFAEVPQNPKYVKTTTPPPINNIVDASLGAKDQVVEE